MAKLRVLMIDDDEAHVFIARRHLKEVEGADFDFATVGSATEGLAELVRGAHDVYLVDYRIGGADGVELIREAVARGCDAPMVMLTGCGSRELELRAMEAGADIFLEKERMDATLLERAIRLAVDRYRMRRELADRARELVCAKKELERSNAELEQFDYVASTISASRSG